MSENVGRHQLGRIPVNLVEEGELPGLALGQTNWRYDGHGLDIRIKIKRGLHRRVFEDTLVHEYGHVLLAANPHDLSFTGGMSDGTESTEEGFCEVVRYLWLVDLGDPVSLIAMNQAHTNPDPLYGGGFRAVWPRYQAHGSILGLRDEVLGIRPVPKSPIPWRPDHPDPEVSLKIEPGITVEGGSHRPTVPFNPDRDRKARPAVPNAGPARPTVQLVVRPGVSAAEHPSAELRPTVSFEPRRPTGESR